MSIFQVGSLEDVLKKMEVGWILNGRMDIACTVVLVQQLLPLCYLILQINERDSGWDDLIFIPPGKSLNQHINEVSA